MIVDSGDKEPFSVIVSVVSLLDIEEKVWRVGISNICAELTNTVVQGGCRWTDDGCLARHFGDGDTIHNNQS